MFIVGVKQCHLKLEFNLLPAITLQTLANIFGTEWGNGAVDWKFPLNLG